MPIMPIRFRCAYCNQLMGISRRKAGTVVRCPTCAGQVVVPDPAQAASARQEAGAQVFERPDFEVPLQKPGPRPVRGAVPARVEVEPIALNEPRGLFLSAGKIVFLILLLLVLLGASFFAGLMVGRAW
jgi:hypothetical protein